MARSVPAAPGHTVHTLLVHLVGARGEARDDADLKPVTS
jgi:hypothetical protein